MQSPSLIPGHMTVRNEMSHPRSCHSGHEQAGRDRGWEELWTVEYGAVVWRTVNYFTFKPQRN